MRESARIYDVRMAKFVLKIEKLSHIIGARESRDLRSPSPIMAPARAQVYSSSRSRVFFKLTADQVLVFDWIAGSCQVSLLKTGQDCSEAG